MTATPRPPLGRISDDGALPWTIGVSAVLHAAGIAALALLPTRLPAPMALESYTVDLVAPSAVGGTNLALGPGKSGPAKAAPPAPKVVPAAEPVTVLPPQPDPQGEEKARNEGAQRKPPPEPRVKPVAEKASAEVEKPSVPPPPAPKPAAEAAPPKPELKPPALPAQAAKPVEPRKESPPVAKRMSAEPESEAATKKKPESKRAVHARAEKAPAKLQKAPTKAEKATAKKPAVGEKEPSSIDRRIADAVERRVRQLRREGAAPAAKSEIDERIAAAVERRARVVRGGTAEGGGPISHGPGSGTGGVVRGVDYILYRGHMEERIKAAWVWAGANRSLRAVVRFNLLPTGEIVNVQIVTASGDPSYDASIERALRAASPLDPPPERYREEFSTVELEFRPEDLQS